MQRARRIAGLTLIVYVAVRLERLVAPSQELLALPNWLTVPLKQTAEPLNTLHGMRSPAAAWEKGSHFTTLLYADALGQDLVIAGGTLAGGIMLAVSVIPVRETDGIATFTMRGGYAPATGMAEFKLNFTGRLYDRRTRQRIRQDSQHGSAGC